MTSPQDDEAIDPATVTIRAELDRFLQSPGLPWALSPPLARHAFYSGCYMVLMLFATMNKLRYRLYDQKTVIDRLMGELETYRSDLRNSRN